MFRVELVWCQAIISKIARWFSVRTRTHHFGIQENEGILVEYNSISFDVRLGFPCSVCSGRRMGLSNTSATSLYIHVLTKIHVSTCSRALRFGPFSFFLLNMIVSVFSILYFLYILYIP